MPLCVTLSVSSNRTGRRQDGSLPLTANVPLSATSLSSPLDNDRCVRIILRRDDLIRRGRRQKAENRIPGKGWVTVQICRVFFPRVTLLEEDRTRSCNMLHMVCPFPVSQERWRNTSLGNNYLTLMNGSTKMLSLRARRCSEDNAPPPVPVQYGCANPENIFLVLGRRDSLCSSTHSSTVFATSCKAPSQQRSILDFDGPRLFH